MNHFINHAMEQLIRFRLKWVEKKNKVACYSLKIFIRLRLAQISAVQIWKTVVISSNL